MMESDDWDRWETFKGHLSYGQVEKWQKWRLVKWKCGRRDEAESSFFTDEEAALFRLVQLILKR